MLNQSIGIVLGYFMFILSLWIVLGYLGVLFLMILLTLIIASYFRELY